MFTSRHNDLLARLMVAPAPGRAVLSHDASTYLEDLGRAAELVAAELAAAELTARMRHTLTPYGVNNHAAGTNPGGDHLDRAATLYPPLSVWGQIQHLDAAHVETVRTLATLTAAQYAAAAMYALGAMLRGLDLTPANLELHAAARAHRHDKRKEPVYGPTARPTLPELATLATGHNPLDLTVGGAYVPLVQCYAAAERLEARDLAGPPTDGYPPMPPAPDAVEATGCEAQVSMLAPLLVAFGHACLDAARFGHIPPTDVPPVPAPTFLAPPVVIELHDETGPKLVADEDGVKRIAAVAALGEAPHE